MPSSTLADAIFWIAVASCLVAQAAILRSVLAGRGAAAPAPLPRRAAEVAWAIVPAVALALVLAATWRSLHPADGAGVAAGRAGAEASL
jgi:hypothetical protein